MKVVIAGELNLSINTTSNPGLLLSLRASMSPPKPAPAITT